MTSSYTGGGAYDQSLGSQSQIARTEFEQSQARIKQMMDEILKAAHGQAMMQQPLPQGPVQGMGPVPQLQRDQSFLESFFQMPHFGGGQGAPRLAATDELIAQARFWDIPNPELIDPAQLHQMIQQKRLGIERDPATSAGSVAMASLGMATEAAGATSRLIGNVFGDLGKIPFAGPALSKILGSEEAKRWMYDFSQRTAEFTEAARASQPLGDKTAFEVMAAAGKVGGYALPAMVAWNTLGAAGGFVPEAWAARVASPIARAAIQGGLTGTILEVGSDEPMENKIFNIGAGMAFGAATAIPRIGSSIGLGMMGAGIGGQVGDTPEERTRHAIEGGIAGAVLGVTPLAIAAAAKVRQDFKSPFDAAVEDAVGANPGGGGGPPSLPPGAGSRQARATVVQEPAFYSGPDYEVQGYGDGRPVQRPQLPGPTEPQLLVRSDPVTSEPIIMEGGQGQSLAGQQTPRGLLMSPQRSILENQIRYYSENSLPTPAAELRGKAYGLPEAKAPPKQLEGTIVTDRRGQPLVVYHGTGVDYEAIDMSKAAPDALYGPGFYTTENPAIASGYAGATRFQWKEGGQAEAAARLAARDTPNNPISTIHLWDIQQQLGQTFGISDMSIFENQGIKVDDLLEPANFPNVKPVRLNIQNPFDIDKTYTADEMTGLISKLKAQLPGYDWENAQDALLLNDAPSVSLAMQQNQFVPALPTSSPLSGEDIYNILTQTTTVESPQGPSVGPEHWPIARGGHVTTPELGKSGLNNALQAIGYDGITHEGGARTGNVPHQVWIAFRPEQVHSPWDVPDLPLDHAATTADALTKQATIMESSTLPEAMGKVQMDDSDVVQAVQASNPGGVNVVRGVHTPLKIIELAAKNGVSVSFVQRPSGWDVLSGNVTPQQVREFTDFGVFTGQKIVMAGTGVEGEVTGVGRGMIGVKTEFGELQTRPENVLPSRFGVPVMKAPELWNAFKQDLMSYMNHEAAGAGMAPVLGMDDPRVPGMLANRMGDFLDSKGIAEPAARQAIDADFNHRWVQDLRNLDYEMRDLQDALMTDAIQAYNETEASDSHHIVASLEENAEKRGFIWVSRPETDGGVFRDTINPAAPDIPVSTNEAAHEFVARIDRALPDYTPASDVPLDVAAMVPSELGREPRLAVEDRADNLHNTLERAQAEEVTDLVDQMGLGGGGGIRPPGGGIVPPGSGYVPPQGPGRIPAGHAETLPEQFARMRRADPSKMHAMEERFKGLLDSHLRYTRYATLKMEKMLTEGGVDLGRAWKHYDELATAHDQAAAEGAQWLQEWGDIMREFPRKILRHGEVTRIHEIQDTNERMQAWDGLRRLSKYQLSEPVVARAIAADDRITDFNHRFFTNLVGDPAFALTMDREIYRYMSHVRARQAQGVTDPYNVPGLNPNVEFFAEHARANNLQFRVMDARELGNHMVRAAMFKKYEAEPWRNLVEAWDDPRVPETFRNYMKDYAQLSRFGYDPKGELAVRGIQSVMGKVFNTPVTMREAQHMLNMPSGAMYMSMLAGRSSIFFRDAIQPMLALAKVEMPHMADTYGKVLKGAGQRLSRQDENVLRDMYQRGIAGGWIQQENPNIEAAGYFEEQPALRENELLHLTDPQAARREILASIGDKTQYLPNWLVRPSESRLSTLKWYAKEGQLNRLIVGESAYQQATKYLQAFRQSTADAVLNLDPTKELGYDQFAEKAFFSSFEPPIQRALKERVAAGDDEGAAQMFAREVANWSQFKYGRKEVPQALRGNIGRMLSMFGSFTGQFLEATNSALANGSTRHRVRFGMTVGTVSAAMYLLKQQTGWSFDKWAWVPQAFQYAGSPFLEMAARGIGAASGAVNVSQGRAPSKFEQAAMQEEITAPVLGTALEFLPWSGYIRSGQEYANAMHSINPLEQIARYTVTGDHGSSIDINRHIEEMVRREGHFPEGQLSPNGGLMPGRPGSGYTRQGAAYPQAGYVKPGPGSGALP